MTAVAVSYTDAGSLRCPRCAAVVGPDQDWCLECGLAARTRLAPTPNWRLPVAAVATIATLAILALGVAFVVITGDDVEPVATTSATAPAPGATAPPAATTTAPQPGATAPATTAPAAAPTATTTPATTTTTGTPTGTSTTPSPLAPPTLAPTTPAPKGGS